LPKAQGWFSGLATGKKLTWSIFNLTVYIYSIAIDAASGRFKLNGHARP
jgi:hypothetical protein